ncbi:MAG: hypothetical protein RI907_3823 [Pseudomonadota bacterium]|jgi:hypothetical protein
MSRLWIAGLLLAVTTTAAQASTITVPVGATFQGVLAAASMTWTGSNAMGQWANLNAITWAAVEPASLVSTPSLVSPNKNVTLPVLTPQAQSYVYDTASAKVTGVQSLGGIRFSATNETANMNMGANGGAFALQDLAFQVQFDGSANVYGHIVGRSLRGTEVDYQGLLFSTVATNVTVDSSLNWRTSFTLSKLSMTVEAFNQISYALDYDSNGLGKGLLANSAANFGTLQAVVQNTMIMPAVPEPASWALMALGLAGVVAARAQRARQCADNS